MPNIISALGMKRCQGSAFFLRGAGAGAAGGVLEEDSMRAMVAAQLSAASRLRKACMRSRIERPPLFVDGVPGSADAGSSASSGRRSGILPDCSRSM